MKKQQNQQLKRLDSNQRLWKISLLNLIVLSVMFLFSLWWQDDYSLKAMADGIWLVFAMQLTLSWAMFVYNRNIFTPMVHGLKTFFLIFVGKKPKEDYFTAYSKVLDHQIPKHIILIVFLMTILVLSVGIILVLLAY
jgi:hypothetical protein